MNLPKLIKTNEENAKPFVVVMAPFATRSGYGEHSRDIIRSLIKADKYRIGLISLSWGMTPLNVLTEDNDLDLLSRIITNPDSLRHQKPDIFIHITIPSEFMAFGKYNIGITAGIETTIAKPEWIEGVNRMDKVIVPSQFTKDTLIQSVFSKVENGSVIGNLQVSKQIDVLFEGTDTNTFKPISPADYVNLKSNIITYLDKIKEDFGFLIVGHWLKGAIGEDRKDIGNSIGIFLNTFKRKNIKKKPFLLIKTSGATFSVKDRTLIQDRIKEIKNNIQLAPGEKLPKVYLLHGDLSHDEMNHLYNHHKIKTLYSFAKGEGYGRPLQEFAFTGKPVVASNWSGQVDFLKPEYHTLLNGSVKQVHPSATDDFIMAESSWFTVDYQHATDVLLNMFNNYTTYKVSASNGLDYLLKEKTLDKMGELLVDFINNKNNNTTSNIIIPNVNLPKLKLPNLNK
jgi:glycosyltransferase involved in cell wall biosynthesis